MAQADSYYGISGNKYETTYNPSDGVKVGLERGYPETWRKNNFKVNSLDFRDVCDYNSMLELHDNCNLINVVEPSWDNIVPYHTEMVTELQYYKSGKVFYSTFQGTAPIKKHNIHYFYEVFK